MNFLAQTKSINGVSTLTPITDSFEQKYIAVREKENRILTDEAVLSLPTVPKGHPHFDEWKPRQASTKSVVNSLKNRSFESALDLGCGNGWFTNKLASVSKEVVGMDMNQLELEQANRVFGNGHVRFCYGDIFVSNLPKGHFNLITLNACVQYFPDAKKLVNRLIELLSISGEIHIIDSPFYEANEIESARKRTVAYYTALGFPEMASNYFHHSWDSLRPFKHEVKHNPNSLKNKLGSRLGISSSPFPWIIIRP
ncbi:MAG: ubiquinone/menaquinone biosynthesis C-methylase UbiE [Bacteroidia bacterium]|jgi:ubiquinone/menaquinone biosynthesis C-methylase UbiE